MKNTLLLLLGVACFSTVIAQTHNAKFSSTSGEKTVHIIFSESELEVEVHSSSDVEIFTDDYKAPPARAKGLKPLYNSAVDNTGIGIEVRESNNTMTIKKASNGPRAFKIKVPENVNLKVDEMDWNGSGVSINGVKGEIEIDAKGSNLKILKVSGPVVANTINGNIDVIYASVNQDQPNSISCTNGYLDVTLPSSTKANLKLKSINGEVYTDFNIDMPKSKEGLHVVYGHKLNGTINGGGVEFSLHSINSDVYIRKAK